MRAKLAEESLSSTTSETPRGALRCTGPLVIHKRLNRSPEEENVFPESKRLKHSGLTSEIDSLVLWKQRELETHSNPPSPRSPLGELCLNTPKRRVDRSGSYVVGLCGTPRDSPPFDALESVLEDVVFKTPDSARENVHFSPCPPVALTFSSPRVELARKAVSERHPDIVPLMTGPVAHHQTPPAHARTFCPDLPSTATSGYVSATESLGGDCSIDVSGGCGDPNHNSMLGNRWRSKLQASEDEITRNKERRPSMNNSSGFLENDSTNQRLSSTVTLRPARATVKFEERGESEGEMEVCEENDKMSYGKDSPMMSGCMDISCPSSVNSKATPGAMEVSHQVCILFDKQI